MPADTVQAVADRYGVSAHTVLGWIRAGELAAVNVARSHAARKPRWRIPAAALAGFEARRAARVEPERPGRSRATRPNDFVKYYG